MKAVKNILETLEVSFEGWTYNFPKGKVVLIEDGLYEHIKGIWSGGVFKKVSTKNKQVTRAKRKKTHAYIKPEKEPTYTSEDMKITQAGRQTPTFGQADLTPPAGTTDKDGVEWYGDGEVIEQPGKVFK
jgi:hypothetical protein